MGLNITSCRSLSADIKRSSGLDNNQVIIAVHCHMCPFKEQIVSHVNDLLQCDHVDSEALRLPFIVKPCSAGFVLRTAVQFYLQTMTYQVRTLEKQRQPC